MTRRLSSARRNLRVALPLAAHAAASLARIGVGFLISCVAGIALALLRMIPPLALTPLLVLWLGIGNATQISIIVLASFFPVFLNALGGFHCVTAQDDELARSLDLPRWAMDWAFQRAAAALLGRRFLEVAA